MTVPRRPVMVTLGASRPAADVAAQDRLIFIETNGFIVRSLMSDDANPRFLEWLSGSGMMRGLNLAGLGYGLQQLREFITRFDNRNNYLLGIFDPANDLLVGFYTIDVAVTHKTGQITTGIGEPGYDGKKTLWATIDALLDHFFAERDVEKISARVLARNHKMLFLFKDNPRFVLEGCLRQECLAPDGQRVDILIFSAFKYPPS